MLVGPRLANAACETQFRTSLRHPERRFPMPKDDFLAVAFTDLNGNHKFNPRKDLLIAALVDTNNDNMPSVGDTVLWGTYPAIPDGSESGTGGLYTSLDGTVTEVTTLTDFTLQVTTASGRISWHTS